MNDSHEPDAREEAALHEEMQALLAVPPLDEVTRRRLVREALARPAPRQSRWVAAVSVAAAIVVGAGVGVVLVSDPTPSDTTTAQRAPSAASDDVDRLENAPAAGAESATGPITPLGDLGDVSNRERLRIALDTAFEKSAGPTDDQAAVLAYPCAGSPPASYGLVAISALATGTYNAKTATVIVGTAPDGRALVVIIEAATCQVLDSSQLPGS